MFTLAISCLTASNLPWFMNLTFHVPMQYCSLQHHTLLPSLVTSTTGCCFHFGSVSSFFLELFLHFSSSILGTYWLGKFIFQCHIFLPFHTVYGVKETCHYYTQYWWISKTLYWVEEVSLKRLHTSWFHSVTFSKRQSYHNGELIIC